MNGDTLEDLIFEQDMKYGEDECIEITLQLLKLVRYIHDQGYVHLDLRIPNVLFKDGRIQLIDFGLARRIGEPLRSQYLYGKVQSRQLGVLCSI